MFQFKSKKELDEKPKFPLLPQDDYELIIVDLERKQQPKYMQPDKMEDIINFTLEITGTRDGAEAKDIEGNTANGRKIFFTGRPNSTGFMKDGTPSKMRTLVAYATGKSVEDEFEIQEWEELLGKTIYAEIIQYTNQKGGKSNKITRFLLPPKTGVRVNVKDEEVPVIEE